MKFRKIVAYEIERYPNFCAECPAFSKSEYRCHNERGYEGNCSLGYMDGCDMRDYSGKYMFCGGKIKKDKRVTLIQKEG